MTQSAPRSLGNLLALLGETDRLVGEVQTVMRRIGVELERLGISEISLSDLPSFSRTSTCAELDALSPREAEIVGLLVDGHRVSTIARSLFISPHTVRNHLQSVYRKVGVGSQAELIVKVKGYARPGPRREESPGRD
jgi:DNA-binding CsgD family transcriptional regulator